MIYILQIYVLIESIIWVFISLQYLLVSVQMKEIESLIWVLIIRFLFKNEKKLLLGIYYTTYLGIYIS